MVTSMITVIIMKKQKIYKNVGGTIKKHGWKFFRWESRVGNSPGGSLIGGTFPGESIFDNIFFFHSNLTYVLTKFKKTNFSDYNDANFKAGLSLFK